jgi:hypothetical protein
VANRAVHRDPLATAFAGNEGQNHESEDFNELAVDTEMKTIIIRITQ